ncbi:MAG: immunoglobulin domain-containing protein, partial [Actinobacteria bacterium]|nr:immunoglobulin domain-containing protein [Actinomycetota bacterium]
MSAVGAVCLLALLAGFALAAPQARAATKPVITIQPTDQSVDVSSQATFISTATGDPKPTVKWEESDDGKSWKAIPGATTNMLKVKAVAYKDGWRYRAVFRNSAGQTFSKAAKLHIKQSGHKPQVTLQPLSQSVIVDSMAVFKATASGTPKPTVQWQQSKNGTVWTYLAGENKTVMSFKAKKAQSGYLYRAVFTNVNGSATTRSAVLTVIDASKKPVVTLQPQSQSVRAGYNAVFTSTATGDPTPTVKWETRSPGGNWKAIAGATKTTYRCEATRARDGDRFRAVFKNSAGQTFSKAAT